MKTHLIFILLILLFFKFKIIIACERTNGKLIEPGIAKIIKNKYGQTFNYVFKKVEKDSNVHIQKYLLFNKSVAFVNKLDKDDRTIIREIDTTVFEPAAKPSNACPINKEFMANNIYYDLDECEIRPDAAIELDKIVMIMLDNEEIRVELGAHTDARANDEYNFLLSQKRAKAALDYLVSKGVNKDRISAIGYGKTNLINNCNGTINCSEKEHQVNRRMEIKLIFEQNMNMKYTRNEVVSGFEDL